ncbi:MAG: hypothetical protein HY720_07075 [Planctomycetes bacterium]|nr:hypothetical protein [Planctomycetota bacterium]
MPLSETKRWVIGLAVTAVIGGSSVLVASVKLFKSDGGSEPKATEVKNGGGPTIVVLDPNSLKIGSGGVTAAPVNLNLPANATEEDKKKALGEALAAAKRDGSLKDMWGKQVAATKKAAEEKGKKVDQGKVEELLAQDPEDFFSADPEIVEVKDEGTSAPAGGEPHFEVRFHFDEDKLFEAMRVVEQIAEKFECPGLGADHPKHKVMVLYRAVSGDPKERQTIAAMKAVVGAGKWFTKKNVPVELYDQATVNEFYAKVEVEAGKVLGPSEALSLAIELKKAVCFYFFVTLAVTPEPGDGVHKVTVQVSVSCQDAKGNILGQGSKESERPWTGDANPATIDSNAAAIAEEFIVPAMNELWETAGPVIQGS